MPRPIRRLPLLLLVSLVTPPRAEPAGDELPPPAAHHVDFGAEVKPILERACVSCHGVTAHKAGLRLDRRDDALSGGDSGPAFTPGQSAESELVLRVSGLEPDLLMPPEGDRLSAVEVGILRAWIDQGAAWPDSIKGLGKSSPGPGAHWSFRPPSRPAVPAVSSPAWARNPIDRFLLARLDAEGLSPSPEADRATLIRRLHLDVLGLPPSPAEVSAFLDDPAPDAYERLVDRVLTSPHRGERLARGWLDAARYADTNGYEKDRDRSIWPYRDWVIRAFNADMPFDRFTIEQLAGDLLPAATLDQRIATGFHRNTMINEEGGIDVEEFRYLSLVDRVATTGAVWLGLTVGCAQCHTHKYDPITQREYYRFLAFFDQADEPEIVVPDPVIATRRAMLEARIAAKQSQLADRFPPTLDQTLDDAQAAWESTLQPVAWNLVAPVSVASLKNATMTVLDDASVLATGDKPNNDVYEVELPLEPGPWTALRLEALTHESLPDGGPGRAPLFSVGDFILTAIEAELVPPSGGAPRRLALRNATEDHCEPGKPAALALDGVPESGWTIKGGVGRPHAAVFELAEPLEAQAGSRLRLVLHQFGIHQMTIGRFRLSLTARPGPVRASALPAEVEAAALVAATLRTAEQASLVREAFLAAAPELAAARKEIESLRASLPRHPTTMVFQERAPEHLRVTNVHPRGEFLQRSDVVQPGVPGFLPPLPSDAPANRLALARWIVSPENPLTARVLVNRVWQSHFGRGLVSTPEDFGTRGEPPSHPELLDWLASELVRQGWSLRELERLILTSATYKQSSRVTPDRLDRDPQNRFLSRGPRFRLDAETIRDQALACAGLLHRRLGGPGVHPPQPEGVTALAYGQAAWPTSTGPDRYRRGLYTFLKRTAPYAAFTTFDLPTSETSCVRRERSNTPLQALTLLNDAVYVEAARALARRVLLEAGPEPGARLDLLYRLALARPPREPERVKLLQFVDATAGRLRSGALDPGRLAATGTAGPEAVDPTDLAAWTAAARAVLNLDETVTRE